MKIDLYTKSVLTAIAVLLALLVAKEYASPHSVAHAQASLNGVQLGVGQGPFTFFDTRTGQLYGYNGDGKFAGEFRVVRLGQNLVPAK
ncbi:MAG TPA: hypothetical protein VHB50_00600 [Bryobacteraceae bacterium]|nr:hypothetical protein [Bryobacteraceae bacterium]